MTMVPLVGCFRGDVLPQLIPVDDTDTVEQMIETLCGHTIGLRLHDRDDVGKSLFYEGERLSPDTTFEDAGIRPMDYIEVRFDDDES